MFFLVSLSGTSVKSGSQLTDTSETFRSTEVSNTMTSGSLFTTKSSAHSMTDTGTSENLERFCRINEDTEQDTETVSDVQVHAGKPSPPVNLDRFQRRAQYYQDDMRDVAEPSMEESIITGQDKAVSHIPYLHLHPGDGRAMAERGSVYTGRALPSPN